MGKASQRKKARVKGSMSSKSKKVLKELLKRSKPEMFVIDDKMVYFNPLKKLLEGETYSSEDGIVATRNMVEKYELFLQQLMNQ